MKKNKLVLLLSLPTLAFSLALTNLNNDFKVAKAAGTYSGGTGTETDPYIISKKDDVVSLRDNVNGGEHYSNTYFTMNDNITLDANWSSPIGVDSTNYFAGHFDGGDYTLNFSDSTMIEISNDNYGLFGYTIGATIENLVIAGDLQVKIKASN
ncbi:MAG: hypothetical protein K5906_02805, partial [Bacilli bacterium]|nr:hypothetical protein [Bacilli bacterium]